jgi:hypothetical protein
MAVVRFPTLQDFALFEVSKIALGPTFSPDEKRMGREAKQ